ncbi:bacteriorhodopsin [Halobaculum sp. MBLA0147]|uniref:bacteriorhodopsin n=1 Tax=Halobaculum sp. MBLA0147 TaxID=3079934 RepID=UPI0035255704
MVTAQTVALAVGAVGMLVGVGIWWRLWTADDTDREAGQFAWLLVIPGAAAVAYALMAAGVGTITVSGVAVPVPRYVDWLVTTPVLIGYVAYVAGASRRAIAATVAVDAAMIVIGFAGVLTTGTLRVVAFALSSLCYVGLLYALYGVFPASARAQSGERERLFEVLQNHVGLLWVAYPVVWAAGPLGFGYVETLGVTLLVTFMDVMAKTPYVYFAAVHRRAFLDEATDGTPDGRVAVDTPTDESREVDVADGDGVTTAD